MATPRILVAPNSYKETFTAPDVAAAMAQGVRNAGATPVEMPLSDGGDGLLDALDASGALIRNDIHPVTGPLGDPIATRVGWLDDATAVIESRLIVGLTLVPPEQRDPLRTTTQGLGELVKLLDGAGRTIVIGLGGSATMDGGVDMARAWGWRPLTADGHPTPLGGEGLLAMRTVRRGIPPVAKVIGLADVENPLCGSQGAAIYGPQKGATTHSLKRLMLGLDNLISVLGDDAASVAARPGSGAAGGLGFALRYFGAGELVSGAAWVLDRMGFAGQLVGCDGVLTGEGTFDATSLTGKTPGLVIRHALDACVPVALVAPKVFDPPSGVHVETGGVRWGLDDIRAAAERAVASIVSLPPH